MKNPKQKTLFNDDSGDERSLLDFPWILMSLKPPYWDLVVSGKKKYEYRRWFISHKVMAFIYATVPRKEIVGIIEFDTPINASVDEIAEIAEKQYKGGGQSIRDYMKGNANGFAIPIVSFRQMNPIKLSEMKRLFPDFHPPQLFLDLTNSHSEILMFLFDQLTRPDES